MKEHERRWLDEARAELGGGLNAVGRARRILEAAGRDEDVREAKAIETQLLAMIERLRTELQVGS